MTKVRNRDIRGLWSRYQALIHDVLCAHSARIDQIVLPADFDRWQEGLNSIRGFIAFIQNEPPIDIRGAARGNMYQLSEPVAGKCPVNDQAFEFADALATARDVLLGSKSAELPNTLTDADVKRQEMLLTRAQNILEFIKTSKDLDRQQGGRGGRAKKKS
jgi:hypothetical protein